MQYRIEQSEEEKFVQCTKNRLTGPNAVLRVSALTTGTPQSALPASAGLLHYKYMPRTGHWGEADVQYAVMTPAETPPRVGNRAEKTAPKTETTNPFAGFDPMTAWTAGQQQMHQWMADAMKRMAVLADEYATLEAQMISRAQGAVANWAQLAQDALVYGAQLSAQARKISVETARKFSNG